MEILDSYNHKLVPPTGPVNDVSRTHLLDAAISSSRHRVIFVQAPAGHGKTTLLRQLMGSLVDDGAAAGWLTLDPDDDDPTRFLTEFLQLTEQAVRQAGGHRSAGGISGIREEQLGEVDDVLQTLNRSRHTIALFIDEFQVVRSDVITSFIARLLARLPAHVMMCFGSRSLPEIGLARLVMRGEALVLKTRDMRFTRAETDAFFGDSLNTTTDRTLLDELYVRTEGWPAALQLARLALRGGADKRVLELLGFSSEPEFEEYLADDVLAAQPDTVQDFLLRTSIVPRFSADLCVELCDRDDSPAVIRMLEQSGLFISPVDAGHHWFRYHSLFSTYLRKQFELRRPGEPAALTRRAARWFSAHGHPADAIACAVDGDDFAFAAEILENWSEQLLREGRLATIERWLDVLPMKEISSRPGLQMTVLWALLFLRRFHRARPLLDALERDIEEDRVAFARAQTMPLLVAVRYLMEDDIVAAGSGVIEIDVDREAADDFESFELGAIANIQSLYLRTCGDFIGARNKALIGSAHSETGRAAFSGAYAIAFMGNAYLAQGRLRDALDTYRRGFETARQLRGSYASAVAAACYGEALYYANALDESRALLEDSLPLISDACMPDALTVAYVTLAKILVLQDKGVDAEYVLREAEKIGLASGLTRMVRLIHWARVGQMIARDDIDEARELANQILAGPQPGPAAYVFHAEELDGDEIGHLRLLLYERHTGEVHNRIDGLKAAPAFSRRPLRMLKLRMIDAVACHSTGRKASADTAILQVMEHAAAEGLSRFVLEEPAFYSLVERAVDAEAYGAENDTPGLRRLFTSLFPERPTLLQSSANLTAILDTLTEREVDILAMLTRGVSNRDIGAGLFVSTNTVKHHLRNIYSKLGVRNRTEATNFALRHGIVG